jgi:hypothetical protein
VAKSERVQYFLARITVSKALSMPVKAKMTPTKWLTAGLKPARTQQVTIFGKKV